LDLRVKTRSNCQKNLKNGFLDPKNPIIHVLNSTVGQTILKIIFDATNGSHFGFQALTELARTFERDTLAKFFI